MGQKSRRWIVIFSAISVLALLAGVGYLASGWGKPSHTTVCEAVGGYDTASEPATLEEVLTSAHQALDEIDHNVQDYSAVLVKKGQIGTDIIETVMFAKIREKPFSVYLNYLSRSVDGVDDRSVIGREVIYVEGRNDGKLLAHTPGILDMTLGTMALAPNSLLAMKGERYPITEIGLANLCRQLIKRGESSSNSSQVSVKRYHQARINTRACTLLEIKYPVHEPKIWGYLARVFVDNEFHFPIRIEVYELPLDRSKLPQIVESYTYLDLKLNNGYTDADFNPKNRQYKFP